VPTENVAPMAPYELPTLEYSYDAFTDYIDKETMEIHHSKHHQAYVDNLNNLNLDNSLTQIPIEILIECLDEVPADKRDAVRKNGGGHANHTFFWETLSTTVGLSGPLRDAILSTFGNIEKFKDKFLDAALSIFGSGWVWLVVQDGELKIVTTANEDSPLMGTAVSGTSGVPIIALDVWEHAYHLKYKNDRAEYVRAFWHVVNWPMANDRYDIATF
jgi:superoxide dismutase, Fe-Mn family